MNAQKTHYVANAVAKIQPFFGLATTLGHFFNNPHCNKWQNGVLFCFYNI